MDKEAARDYVRMRVIRDLKPLLDAQIAAAMGIRLTLVRDKSRRFVHITDPAQIAQALNAGDEGASYWTYTKPPRHRHRGPDEPGAR